MIKLPFDDLLPGGVCDFERLKDSLISCRALFRLPQNAASVIVYLFPYYLGEENYKNLNISKYAVSEDYHLIVSRYLEMAIQELKTQYPEYRFEGFCDNSPIPEVKAASLAGLGVIGENGLLIHPRYGSFCFIAEIVTDLKLTPFSGEMGVCLHCGKCREYCPAHALCDGGIDKVVCLSNVTQRKGDLSQAEQRLIRESGCAWGCDICQIICPMNRTVKSSPIREFYETAKPFVSLTDGIENRAFSWRGEKVIKRNLAILCCKEEENNL